MEKRGADIDPATPNCCVEAHAPLAAFQQLAA